ncbi:sigma factor [Sphingopyxis sp. LK2115]|uniref:sigma factor n=1 Tax=Sphingopyxis sp. LK2115 TaxID=2744558 RepID=UPI0016610019|nr:sigma factor [Sphingopyxis sp. LK2115]
MSAKSDALEAAVSDYIRARTALDVAPGARARARADRSFARLAALLDPRIRYFTRVYGLSDIAEDAAQVCAIALHRAAERYEPRRARFTTYVNWQFRAELQALRHRLYGDQRRGGRRCAATTLPLDALQAGADDWLADIEAEPATERAAADHLAASAADRLVRDWADRRRSALRGRRVRVAARLDAECALVRRQLAGDEPPDRLRESDRHVVRRAIADIARHAAPQRGH